ncbi:MULTISPECIES: hypothetical protein [Bacillaceae]|uniref:Uncharacterized protein n=2 Tax=Bacillaceae TaxID=186817 RepID=A0A9D5HYS1_9BACI|nr:MULTISPECIES: hypothetical protein [Bacillaceae]KQL58056.1 hypothetical protein AN965_07030 [Alkalicoccobacillus plakortidis]WDF02979.1 hypothetical protein PQ477_15955 [Shouchella hunanensis]
MKFEVIAFWSDKDKEGMVCVKKNGSIIDSELTPKMNESEFLVWRKVKSLAFLHKYNLMGVNPVLVK